MDLDRGREGVLLTSGTSKLSKVLAYAFDQASIVQMPTGTDYVALYDLGQDATSHASYNWSPDIDYVAHVIRSLAGAEDPRLADIITWLELHADATTDRVSVSGVDPAAAFAALRSGELAKRLAADRDMLRAYTHALKADPKIASLVETATALIAEEEREAIRARTEKQLAKEIEDSRRLRIEALNTTLLAYEEKKRDEIENRLASQSVAIDASLAKRKAKGEAEIDHHLATRKASLEMKVSELTQKRDAFVEEIKTLEKSNKQLSADIAALREQEAAAATNLDRLLTAAAATGSSAKRSLGNVIPLKWPTRGRIVAASELKQAISNCPLLTSVGKASMEQFVALSLAGDIPILTGPDVADFLLVAEALLSSGASARLEADPTIIAFEDLWVRVGTGAATPLAQALDLTSMDDPVTVLAVVEKAERSGARFWFPSLADRARRGDLPRRLLVCVTVEDVECEEARAILPQAVRLEIRSTIINGAAAIAGVALGASERREFDPGEWPTDIVEGMRATVQLVDRLGLGKAIRAARAAVEATRLTSEPEALAAGLSIARLFVSQTGEESPSLAILPGGKSSA
ncbi:MAG TPA: hypothetical protein VD978_36865 [Azospirillum sp.]|nr:hypothetical protein [Azospirillum sp.]